MTMGETIVFQTMGETCPICGRRWAVVRIEDDQVHLRCRRCNHHWSRPQQRDERVYEQGDYAELSPEAAGDAGDAGAADSSQWVLSDPPPRPGRVVRALARLLSGLDALLVWFGMWLDGETPEQIERHGG